MKLRMKTNPFFIMVLKKFILSYVEMEQLKTHVNFWNYIAH